MKFPWSRKIPQLEPKEGYQLWARSYREEANPVKSYSDQYIESSLPSMAGIRVLDAGCGPGKFCRLAEDAGALAVTGIDLSEGMIAQARLHCQRSTFICSDLAFVSIEANVHDLAICALVLGHCASLADPLRTLAQTLRSGGILLITDFHPWQSEHHAKRTFIDPITKKVFEIRHHVHKLDFYQTELARLGLTIENVTEPLWQGHPLIIGIKATKN